MAEIDNLSISISASAAAAIAELDKLASSLTRFSGASRKVKTSADSVNKGFEDVASSAQKAETHTSSFADKLGKLQSTLNGTIKKSLPDFKEFTKQAKTLGNVALGPVISSFKSLGNSAKGAMSSVSGLFSTISRIAFYRVIRSAIKEITQGISDGIKNLYHYSETFNGTFYKSMNQIATEAQYLKNSLGAMFEPLIEYVTPFVTFITDKLVGIINLVNQFISALTGKSTYTAAKKVAAVWDDSSKKTKKTADNTKKASNNANKLSSNFKKTSSNIKDAADELKRFTLGFDELNILGKNVAQSTGGLGGSGTPSTGGTGARTPGTSAATAGTTGTDYSSMFQSLNISSAIKALADEIKNYIKNGNWEGLGTLIGEKINAAINSVNWEGLGNKVGKALNGVIETAYYLLSAIGFANIGSRIAEFLNGAIDSINFNTLGRLMVKRLTIIPDMIIGFFTGFNWGQAAGKFSDFVNGMYEELTDWFNKYNWVDIGTTISGKLFDAITNINFYGIAKNMFLLWDAALFAAIGVLAGFFDGLAGKIKGYIKWDSLSDEVKNQITIIGGIIAGASTVVGAVLAFSGINIPLGIGLMAAGLAIGATIAAMNTNLSKLVMMNMKLIKIIVSAALLVVGAILAFSGVNIPLGIGLLAAGAVGMGKTVKENWSAIQEKMEGPLGILAEFLSGLTLVLGFVAVAGGAIPLGIGLIVAGSVGLATALAARWDRIKEKMEGPIGTLTSILSGAMLVLGFVAIAAGRIPLGIGLIVAGSMGLATAIAANWGRMKSLMEGPLGILTNVLSAATLVLGFVAIAAGFIPLGIGLIVAGSAGLAAALPARWNRLQSYMEGPLGVLTGVISAASLVLGMVALVAGHIPLGVGLLVAGAAGLATSKGFNFSSLKNYFTGWMGALTGVVSAASLVLGIIALVGGNIPLGIGLIMAGSAGLVGTIDANWDNLVQFGKDAKNKLKEGWDSITLSLENPTTKNGGTNKNATDWSPKFKSDTETLQRYIDNLGKGVDLDIRVSLVKDAWTSVADWATNTGVDVNAKVALVKASWDTVSEWANRYIGVKINQSVGLQREGWTILSKWVEKFKDPKVVYQTIGLVKRGWSTVSSWVNGFKGGTVEQGINLSVKNWNSFLGGISSTLHNWFPSIFAEGGAIEHGKVSRFAGGGVIHAYAGGTSSAHGSLFLAGEAGPEIVGHVGGRTEVLNRSQLAATMYAAVNAAMAPAAANFASAAAYMYEGANGYAEDDMEMLLQLVRAGSEATQRQNELLRQQNEYLRQINAKEFSAEISTADINRAQARSNRRAGTTIVPMTT